MQTRSLVEYLLKNHDCLYKHVSIFIYYLKYPLPRIIYYVLLVVYRPLIIQTRFTCLQLHGKVKEVSGSPRTEIIRVAEEEKVNMIITGSRGMGTVKRTLLGSVSDHVLHHAHVPVLVCKHKDDHK